jgi:isopentenyl-diphosphate delta-isomerase
MKEEKVVLVNEANEFQGTMNKMEAHEKGVLHRAISILIYNSQGEMLIQQRAKTKYHWPMIWSNAVCSHPRENETFQEAADRRLKEELNISCSLSELYRFVYQATDETTGLIEHEYDVVFQGVFDDDIPFNSDEVNAVQWIKHQQLIQEVESTPEKFSFWFKEILKKIEIS